MHSLKLAVPKPRPSRFKRRRGPGSEGTFAGDAERSGADDGAHGDQLSEGAGLHVHVAHAARLILNLIR